MSREQEKKFCKNFFATLDIFNFWFGTLLKPKKSSQKIHKKNIKEKLGYLEGLKFKVKKKLTYLA